MADKSYTIPIGDETIELPAWATQTTLEQLSIQTSNAVDLTNKLLGTVSKNKELDKELVEAVKTNTEIGMNNADANHKEAKGRTSVLLKGAKLIKDTAGFFGDSEKPLTSMVKATEMLVGKMKGTNGKLTDTQKESLPFMKSLKKYGKQVGSVAVDVGLAWAGWNAAKFEQFAEVQRSMIDSGAIVFDTSDAFNELYTDAFQSGITYKTFSEVVANFGGTMVGLGGDASRGSQSMMRLFKTLETNADELGDLGFTNKELLNSYASYIETQRLTGSLDKQLVGKGELLEENFKNLVMESGAVANLTSMNRSEAMSKMLGALSDTSLAAGMTALEDAGLDDTALVVGEIAKQFGLFSDMDSSGLLGNVQTALNKATSQFSGDMSRFNITQVLQTLDSEAVAALEMTMPGLLDEIDKQVIDAEKNNGEISKTFLLDILKTYDKEKVASSSAAGTGLGKVQSLQDSLLILLRNVEGLSGADLDKEIANLRAKYKESGTSTVAMNDMSKAFLTAQEFITLPMQSFGEKLEFTTGLLGDGASWLNGLFNDYTGEGEEETVVDSKMDNDNEIPKKSTHPLHKGNKNNNNAKVNEVKPMNLTAASTPTTFSAQIAEMNLVQLRDRLTETQNNVKINENGPTNRGNVMKGKRLARELELIEAQIKMLEQELRVKENKFMNEQYQLASGVVNNG